MPAVRAGTLRQKRLGCVACAYAPFARRARTRKATRRCVLVPRREGEPAAAPARLQRICAAARGRAAGRPAPRPRRAGEREVQVEQGRRGRSAAGRAARYRAALAVGLADGSAREVACRRRRPWRCTARCCRPRQSWRRERAEVKDRMAAWSKRAQTTTKAMQSLSRRSHPMPKVSQPHSRCQSRQLGAHCLSGNINGTGIRSRPAEGAAKVLGQSGLGSGRSDAHHL